MQGVTTPAVGRWWSRQPGPLLAAPLGCVSTTVLPHDTCGREPAEADLSCVLGAASRARKQPQLLTE